MFDDLLNAHADAPFYYLTRVKSFIRYETKRTHALMCVNHHAYAVLEGGAERDVVALREAIRVLDGLIPEGSEACDGVAA